MMRRLASLDPSALAVGLSLVVLICLPQVLSSTETSASHAVYKRNVGVLARTGQLPYSAAGKRYVASLARSGQLPLYAVHKKLHPGMTSRNQLLPDALDADKRYMASLTRAGALPYQFAAKRDDGDGDGDGDAFNERELESLKALEAETKALETVLALESQLNLELLKEKLRDLAPADADADAEADTEKRSMASLARGGNLPLHGDKRSVEALARAGYLPATPRTMAARNDADAHLQGVGKRGVATLAKNGFLGKRGGIGSLARNNLLPQKKSDELDELETLIRELARDADADADADADEVAKRNLGALARGGGYARYAQGAGGDVGKRNLASLARSRAAPLREGKRYLGALARSQNMPLHKRDRWLGGGDAEKRVSPMAIAKTWHYNTEGLGGDGVAKRYVAALLRQGRLPVGPDEAPDAADADPSDPDADDKEVEGVEAKRHISSLKGKRSVPTPTATPTPTGTPTGTRGKREATYTDEYPMPNVQNSELFDYDDLMEVMTGGAAPEKRFLGSVARSGWFRDSSRDRGYRAGLDAPGKRHIGALARLGWLPQLRSSRYRRFGRAMPSSVCKRSSDHEDPREDPADGAPTQDADAAFWRAPTPLPEGRRRTLLGGVARPPRGRYLATGVGRRDDGVLLGTLYSAQPGVR